MITHSRETEIDFDIHEDDRSKFAKWTLNAKFFGRKAIYDMYAGADEELEECLLDFKVAWIDKGMETVEKVQRSKRPAFHTYEETIIELRFKNKLICKGTPNKLVEIYESLK